MLIIKTETPTVFTDVYFSQMFRGFRLVTTHCTVDFQDKSKPNQTKTRKVLLQGSFTICVLFRGTRLCPSNLTA
jgi:hypothetical protein